jgi:hypothetical protein
MAVLALLILSAAVPLVAAEEGAKLELAGGKLEMTAPAQWVRKRPANMIIEYEFAIPAAKGDPADGRLTVMSAGGGVEANLERWYGQFTQPEGGNTRERAKVRQVKIDGEEVHLVDIAGTYKDQPPGRPGAAVERPKYRMLGAAIATKSLGTVYVKFYGPEHTVGEQEKAFLAMIEGLKHK